MIIILVQTLLTKTQCLGLNETNWGRLRTKLCSEFELINQSLFSASPTSKAMGQDSLLFDAVKAVLALTLCILSLCFLFRLFRIIQDITNHNNDLISVPQYLLKTNFNKIFISIVLVICFLCLLAQFSFLIQNAFDFQSSVKKTICAFMNFPSDFSGNSKPNHKQQISNHNEYHSELRRNQKLLQQISMGARKIYTSMNENSNVESSVTDYEFIAIKSQCMQLQNVSINLNTFISRARQIIYFVKYSLSSLMFEGNIKWFIVQLPQILAAIFSRVTLYSFLFIIFSTLAFFRFKFISNKQNQNQSFRRGIFCIFFVPFCFLLNSTINTVFVPLTGSICRIIDRNGYAHVLDYFPIDPSIKPTLQQLLRKIDNQSDGNLLSAFQRKTITVYQQFLRNSTTPKQRKGLKLIYSNQIEAELQSLRNYISLIIENIDSSQSNLNKFSLRVIGEYIEGLLSQICQDNFMIWSKIARRQFCIAVNTLVFIACISLYLLQLRKQQKYSIYSSLQPELSSIGSELDK